MKTQKLISLCSIFLVLVCFSLHSLAVDTAFDDLGIVDEPLISPTRLQQPLRDVPASVTVIDEHTISALQLREIPDILRLVPGVTVGLASGNDYRISYHGGNGLIPRRMQVLIDGMPIYQSGYAKVDWKSIGISIADVSRVEVTRTPSSATYGANAFSAVINIITKTPALTPGVEFRQDYTTRDAHETYLRYGSSIGTTQYRVSVSGRGDQGYDKNSVGVDRRDGTDYKLFNFSSHTDLQSSSIDAFLGVINGESEVEFADRRQASFPDSNVHNWFANLIWNTQTSVNNSIKASISYTRAKTNQDWRLCYPLFLFTDEMRNLALSNPAYALAITNRKTPSGGTAQDQALYVAALAKISSLGPLAMANECSTTNQDFIDESYVTEVQDTYSLNKNVRYVVGLGNRHNSYESETYVNGTTRADDLYLFGTTEINLGDFVFNAGAMAEYQEDYTDGIEVSPRASLNYRIDDRQTLKFIISKAIRTPDFLENERDWSYYGSDFSVPFDGKNGNYFYYHASSTEKLKTEKILSKEIVYMANIPELGLLFDIKVYEENLDDLISEKLQFADYHPTNDGWLDNTGAEIELRYTPSVDWLFGATYAYQDSKTNNDYELMLYSRHSGSFYAVWNATSSLRFSAQYEGSNNISGFSFDRFGLGVTKIWSPNFSTSFSAVRTTANSGYTVDYNSQVLNRYNTPYEAIFGVKLSF